MIKNKIKNLIRMITILVMCMFYNGCLMCYHKVHTLWCWWHLTLEKW